jgi:hypothetical protein
MLTPLDIKYNYLQAHSLAGKDNTIWFDDCLAHVTEQHSFTQSQWDNLVKVCSVIKANQDRFDMRQYHTHHSCGTVHCIAGWAISLELNDTNTTANLPVDLMDVVTKYSDNKSDHDPRSMYVSEIAGLILSNYVIPFFYLTYSNHPEFTAEELVMQFFVDPILAEAERESYELTQEVKEFISRAKEETKMCAMN